MPGYVLSVLLASMVKALHNANQIIIHSWNLLLTALTKQSEYEPADSTVNEDTSDSGSYITRQGGCRRQP